MNTNEIKKLYTALRGKGYSTHDLGDEKTFETRMGDKNNRKELYDWVSSRGDFHMGNYNKYEERLTSPMQPEGTTTDPIRGISMAPEEQAEVVAQPQQQAPIVVPKAQKTNSLPQQEYINEDELQKNREAFKDEFNPEYVEGFGQGFKQGWKGMKEGVRYLAGETANLITGTSRDDKAALDELNERVKHGEQVSEERAPWLSRMFDMWVSSHPALPLTVRNAAESRKEQDKLNKLINQALEDAGGDIDQARRILARQWILGKTWGDRIMEDASKGMSELKPTRGFGAWVGNLVPQMIPPAAAVVASVVTKNPKFASLIGKVGMGAMTAATAGQSMKEARDAGASDSEVWAVGIVDGAIEYATEKIPFDRYTIRLFNGTKKKVGQELAEAVVDNNSPARNELERLLTEANKKLGVRLLNGKNVKDFAADILAEGASEFTAEALQTITPMIYENPEDYPTINEILQNGWEGTKAGLFMGAVLGGASKSIEHQQQRSRRKEQGFVDIAQVKGNDGLSDVAEIVGRNEENGNLIILQDGETSEVAPSQIEQNYRFSFEEFERGVLQSQSDDAYDNGYSLETSQELNDAKNMLDVQAENIRRTFALDEDVDIDEFLGDDPIEGIMLSMRAGASEEEQQAKLDYINAKATYDGMLQRMRDDIDSQVEANNQRIDHLVNRDTKMVVPAKMKQDDRPVYIVGGNVVLHDDGSVNNSESTQDIIIYDEAKGDYEFTSPSAILEVGQSSNAEELKTTQAQQIAEQYATMKGDQIDGVLPFAQGDTYNILGEDGVQHTAQIIADNGDGSVQVVMDGATEAVVMPKQQVQAMSQAYNKARAVAYNEQKKAKEVAQPRKLTSEEVDTIISAMESNAVPAPEIELTPENWVAEFGENGIVATPIGDVKMGENQYFKLAQKGRESKLGMIKPTLQSPDFIVEEKSSAKDGQVAERNSSYVFVKAFTNADGTRTYKFTSVTIRKDGREVVISNQEKETPRIKRLLREGMLTYISEATLPSEPTHSTQGDQQTIPSGATLSDSKGTTSTPQNQDVEQKNIVAPAQPESQPQIPTLKNGEPDYNAMDADMFTEQYVSQFGEGITETVARNNIKEADKKIASIKKQIEGITDPNKLPALYTQLKETEEAKAKYTAVIENLGLSEDATEDNASRVQRMKQEATPRIAQLFPDGLPNAEAVILADIATGNKIRWSDKVVNGAVVSKGLGSELGLAGSNAERTRRIALIGKDAPTPEEYAEQLRERLDAMGIRYEESELRDKVIDVYSSADTRGKAWEQLEEMSANMQAEPDVLDYEEEQMRRAYERSRNEQPQDVDFEQAEPEIPSQEEYNQIAQEFEGEEVAPAIEESQVERTDKQGNRVNQDGNLVIEVVESIDEITDEDFENPHRTIQLPQLPQNVNDAIGADGKPVIIKKNIFERNAISHSDLTPEQSRQILKAALYSTKVYGQNQKKRKPYNWVVISVQDEATPNKLVLLEVNEGKENVEIVHWHYIDQRGLEKLKRQAEREDGQLLILPSENSEEVGALADPTPNLPSDNKDTTSEPKSQEVAEKISQAEVETNIKPSEALRQEEQADVVDEQTEQGQPTNEDVQEEELSIEDEVPFMVSSDSVQTTTEAQKLATEAAITALEDAGVEVVNATPEMVEEALQQRDVRLQAVENRLIALKKAENFVVESLQGKKRNKSFRLTLPYSTLSKIRVSIGRDFDSHNLDGNSFVHSKRLHGINGEKIDASSIPLSDKDFALAPYIMVAPDRVARGSVDAIGRESIRFEKTLSNGVVVVVEKEQKNSPSDMDTITMWADLSGSVMHGQSPASTIVRDVIATMDDAKIRKDAENAIRQDVQMHIEQQNSIDAAYMEAVKAGDMDRAKALVREYAESRGYYLFGEFRDAHVAPSSTVDKPDFTNANLINEKSLDEGWDVNLYSMPQGENIAPNDFWSPMGPRRYMYNDKAGIETHAAIVPAIRSIQYQINSYGEVRDIPSVKVYRAVPNSVFVDSLENGDWVTPSLTYANNHGLARFGEGEYRIIEQEVPATDLWWDGNDAREWGYDNGNVEAYANTPNHIKLLDPITYDDAGNIIPLSARFDPTIADSRFSIGPAPVFVSNAKIAVLGIKQEKATPEQWLKMIEKAGGLKAGEDKWIGLSDWLQASDKKTLTKQEVLDYINENQIQIEEAEYGESSREFEILKNEYEELLRTEGYDAAHEEMIDRFGDDFDIAFGDLGGELTIDNPEAAATLLGTNNYINNTRLQYTTDGLNNKQEIALTVPTIEPWNENDEVHFGDAGEGRAVAWVRFGETTDADGKRVLVIDEVQSKRHQEGREKGYISGDIKAGRAAAKKRLREAYDAAQEYRKTLKEKYNWDGIEANSFSERVQKFTALLTPEEIAERERLDEEKRKADEEWDKYDRVTGAVPEAPFEKNWAELAIKRMLRYAAENGFDKVAWTKGNQQAERYDLSKQIDYIDAQRNDNGTYDVNVATEDDSHFLEEKGVSEARLSELVGKELAMSIVKGTQENEGGKTTIEGDNLRIGGEGMRAFYDQMLPSFMRKYGKKWGATVQDVTLPNVEEAGRTMHSVDVTDSMRESVMQGQPMFYRRPNGTVYGWTNGTTVYLTEAGMNPNTPIHEYTHIWADAMRKHNPEGWKSIVKLLKGTPVWNEVMADANYANIHGDENQVASEVLSRISGRENAAKMEAMAQQMIDENANDTVKKHRARKLLDRMRKALQEFWSWVGKELFGIKNFESIEQVTDRILYDLVSGTDLTATPSLAGFRIGEKAIEASVYQKAVDIASKVEKSYEKFGIATDVVVAVTPQDFYDVMLNFGVEENLIDNSRKAVYVPNANRIIINSSLIESDEDLLESLIHEESHKLTLYQDNTEMLADAVESLGERRFVEFASQYIEEYPNGYMAANEIISNFAELAALMKIDGKYAILRLMDGEVTTSELVELFSEQLVVEGNYSDVVVGLLPILRNHYQTLKNSKDEGRGKANFVSIRTSLPRGSVKTNHGNFVEADNMLGTSQIHPKATTGFQDRGENTAEQTVRVGRDLTALRESANELASQLNTPIRIVEDVNTITDSNAKLQERKRKAKGYFDPKTGEVVVVLPNATSVEDVRETILHEVVGHKGLQALVGKERFNAFLDKVYANASEEVRRRIAQRVAKLGWDFREATEEYIAEQAERGFEDRENRNFFEVVRDLFLDMLRRAKIALGYNISDNDIRYMLWRTYQMQRSKGAMAVAEDIAMQHKLGVGNFRARLNDLKSINEQFNKELQEYINNGAKANTLFHLGMPQGVMRTFLPNLPIVMRPRIMNKSSQTKHNVDATALRNLPTMISEPIFVFQRDNDTLGVLTEIKDRDGKNVCVAIELNKTIQNGGVYLEVNDIRSIHGREASNIILPIAHNNTLKYVDKEKGLNWLSSASYNYQQEIDSKDLSTATKIVENFENPKFTPANDVPDIRFRDGGSTVSSEGIATGVRAKYEKLIKKSGYQVRETSQDKMLSLRRFMEMTAKAFGIPMEKIKDWENAYQSENALSSKNEVQVEEFDRLYGAPLIQTVQELRKKGYTYEQIDDYLQIKHGIERNREMAVRAAISDEEGKINKEKLEKWNAAKERVSNDQTLDSWEKEQRELDRIAKDEFGAEFGRDYSGLTAMYPDTKGNAEDAMEKGYAEVNTFENNAGQSLINELWKRIRAANMQTLNKTLRTGLISKETFDSISSMYSYYVPLRGFAETTSDEVYGYLNNEPMAFNAPIRKARGRGSKADQVLPNILSAAHSAILQGNRNAMKNHFLNFVEHYPTDLVSVQNMWVEYDKLKKEWVAKFPDINDADTAEEVAAKTQAFEERMQALKEKYPKQYKRVTSDIDVPYIVPKHLLKQHQILVKRNGVDVVLTVNGSPRLAIVMNGTQPTTTLLGKAKDGASAVTRYLSSMYTSLNPEFVVSNYIRDAVFTNLTVWVRESPAYAARFNKNKSLVCNPVNMGRLILKYSTGTLDMNNEVEKAFYDFVMNGGETGYAKLASIEQLKKDIGHMIDPTMLDNVKALSKKLTFLNRSAESSARFAAFLTSRQMGRSVARSVADAKEISVNFNRKGAGDLFMDAKDQTWIGKVAATGMGWAMPMYAFFNAGIQGLTLFLRIHKRAPLKATALTTGIFLLGALISTLLEGDDEEEYYALPESVRRQNIVFRVGNNTWAKIPLPIEMRAIYGLGEMSTSIAKGKEDLSNHGIAYKMAEQLSQTLPINVLEGEGGLGTLVPTLAVPIAEALSNEDWMGYPIYREDIYKGDKDIPEYQRVYARTGKGYVAVSKFLNDITGGDNRKRGAIQVNPAVIEHIVDGYLGGPAQFMNKVISSAEMAFGDKEFDMRSVPFVNRVLMLSNATTSKKTINNYYFRHLEEAEEIDRLVKNYLKDAENPSFTEQERAKAAEKAQKIIDSEEWAKAQAFLERASTVEEATSQYKDAPAGTSDDFVFDQKAFANEVYKREE